MRSTALAGMSFGAGRPGNGRGRDHDVEVRNPLLERGLLLRLLLGRELARVAARRLLALDAEVEERRAEALDLLLHRGPTSNAETTAPSRRAVAIACRPATPAPMTSARTGAIVPAAVISIGKRLLDAVGGEQHRLVAGDGRLRRERVHRLRARDSRDRLHREGDDALLAQPRDALACRSGARGSR